MRGTLACLLPAKEFITINELGRLERIYIITDRGKYDPVKIFGSLPPSTADWLVQINSKLYTREY